MKTKNKISEIDINQNVFELFNKAQKIKVISMPFTGPSYVSNFFNIKTCFYDPTGDVLNEYEDKINIIKNLNDLRNFINDET